MRNVMRTTIPDSLAKNAAKWTNELLAEISKHGEFAKVPEIYKNKYRQDDVKEALNKMYKNHCCYCESVVGKEYATYGRIEHLKPKSVFPAQCFEWNNLHWSCEVCNTTYKQDNWDPVNPILDPCVDDISAHLYLDTTTGEYVEKNASPRGITTIRDTGMNREGLVEARRSKIIELATNYRQYKMNGTEKEFIRCYQELKEMLDYPGVYEAFIESINEI